MKIVSKLYSLIFILVSVMVFTQIPVTREQQKPKTPEKIVVKSVVEEKMSPRDSIQEEIKDIVYYLDFDIEEKNVEPEEDKILVLRKKIKETKGIHKTLLRYYLANMYLSYSTDYSNYIKQKDITPLSERPEDYRLWSEKDFHQEINQLFRSALEDTKILQNEKTEWWNQLIKDAEFAQYKPTLYDLVVTSYLHYLDVHNFKNFPENDKVIEKYRNDLVQFHRNDLDKTASVYLQSTLIKGSDAEQVSALEKLADENITTPFSAYLLSQAADLMQESNLPNSLNKANQLCRKAIDTMPVTDWNKPCKLIINELESKDLHYEIPEIGLPNEYIPLVVRFKNVSDLEVEFTKQTGPVNFTEQLDWANYRENYGFVTSSNNLYEDKSFRTDIFQLPKFDDFQNHQTTLALPPFTNGLYTLKIISNGESEDFSLAITDLHYVKRFEDNKTVSFQVISSKTGKSVANRNFLMYQNINDFEDRSVEKRRNNLVKTGSGITTKDGLFSLPKSEKRKYNQSIIYFPELNNYIVISDDFDDIEDEKDEDKTTDEDFIERDFIIYTDRAIYRPGQKVFYKGILKQEYFEKTKVLSKEKVLVKLMDGNDKEIAKAEAITNEFGSVSGSFLLMNTDVVGTFYIQMETVIKTNIKGDQPKKVFSSQGFKVEEYKRPKFRLVINPVLETYQLEDFVKITGKADAFSGTALANVGVNYEVKRKPTYYWSSYDDDDYYGSFNDRETEIANGEATTDEAGNFEVSFLAAANPADTRKKKSYRYEISFYATDINGESQANTTLLSIGDVNANIKLDIEPKLLQQDWKNLNVKITNLNGQKIETQATVKITKLLQERKIIVPKYEKSRLEYNGRNQKKSQVISYFDSYDQELFDVYLPHFPSHLFQDKKKLEKGEMVYLKDFNTKDSETISLNKNPEPGKYLVEAVAIINGDSISSFKVVEILDSKTFKNGSPAFFGVRTDKKSYKVGEKAKITFFSDFKEAYASYFLSRSGKDEAYQYVKFKDGKAEIVITITDTDLKKGLYCTYDFIHDSDYAEGRFKIEIQENINRNLEITTEVFRDKIQPGAKEKWILTIKGKDKDKVNAEVLATMYDASLDQFAKNNFNFNHHQPRNDEYRYWDRDFDSYNLRDLFRQLTSTESNSFEKSGKRYSDVDYDDFNILKTPKFNFLDITEKTDYSGGYAYSSSYGSDTLKTQDIESVVVTGYGYYKKESTKDHIFVIDGKIAFQNIPEVEISESKFLNAEEARNLYGEIAAGGAYIITSKKAVKEALLQNVKARTNLNETAFFFPILYTDTDGNIKIEFTSPEALTQWKLLLFAHTKDLKTGSAEFFTQTQKELMVTPNPPRFLRQGDEMYFSAKIDNLSDQEVTGNAMLYLFDAQTNKSLDSAFVNINNLNTIHIDPKSATNVTWKIKIPYNVDAVTYKILASTGKFSDGEENILPVLTDRMLVTETIPIFIKEGQAKNYEVAGIVHPVSESAANFNLSVQLTANPLWYAVLAIPYLKTYPYECSEQLFSRLYGNMLASYILNSSPKIKEVFDEWNDKETLNDPLEANEELKSILIAETPWLSKIQDKEKQMEQLAVFFNLNRMKSDLKKAQRDLVDRQNADGSFSWFPGGGRDKTISGHILAGFGKLNKMLKKDADSYFTSEIKKTIKNSIEYLDKTYYDKLIADRKVTDKIDLQDYAAYFYNRSFWLHQKEIPSELRKELNKITKNYISNFSQYSTYHQAMIITFLNRYGYKENAEKLVLILKATAKRTEENGMYWENNKPGWSWYQAPVEAQAMMIEAFAETTPEDEKSIEEMKIWLLKNKRTENWASTRSTTEAVYALLNYGKSWENAEKGIQVSVGKEIIYPETNPTANSTAGFFKKSYRWKEITADKGKVEVKKSSPGVAWGGIYYQYYETLNNIMANNSSDVTLEKKLYTKIFDGNVSKLIEITDINTIKLGDLVTVRLVIKTTKDMQYIHLKDMRGSGFEPVNVLSSYKYQNGTGYYESTKDVATNFFFDYLPGGTFVFEYDLKANNAGTFSNGITTFQNMYAPEMSAHSGGRKITIEK